MFSTEVGQQPLVWGWGTSGRERVETRETVRCVLPVSWQQRDGESCREADGSLEPEEDCFKTGTPAWQTARAAGVSRAQEAGPRAREARPSAFLPWPCVLDWSFLTCPQCPRFPLLSTSSDSFPPKLLSSQTFPASCTVKAPSAGFTLWLGHLHFQTPLLRLAGKLACLSPSRPSAS